MDRAKRILNLARQGFDSAGGPSSRGRRYSIVKIFELGKFVVVPTDEIVPCMTTSNLNMTNFNGKEYWCITFDTGDLIEMEAQLNKLNRFNNLEANFKYLTNYQASTQTVTSTTDRESQTEVNFDHSAQVETLTGETTVSESLKEISTAYQTLWGDFGVAAPVKEPFQDTGTSKKIDSPIPSSSDNDKQDQLQSVVPSTFNVPSLIAEAEEQNPDDSVAYDNPPHEFEDFDTPEDLMIEEPMHEDDTTQTSNIDLYGPGASTAPQILRQGTTLDDGTQTSNIDHLQAGTSTAPQSPRQGTTLVGIEKKRKLQHCVFCNMGFVNLKRHLFSKHNTEERVRKIMNLENKNPLAIKELHDLRREGNALLNFNLMREGKQLIPIKRGTTTGNLVSCPRCGAIYSKLSLHKHYKRCTGTAKVPKKLVETAHRKALIASLPGTLSETLKKEIIPGMHPGIILNEIINDPDIVSFGNRQCMRFKSDMVRSRNPIRSRLRALGRLKIEMQRSDPSVKRLADIFDVTKWDEFISAVAKCAHLEKVKEEKSPTTVRSVGYLMLNIAMDTKVSIPLFTEEGKKKRKEIQAWVERFQRQYNDAIGRPATQMAEQNKFENKSYEPVARDIVKLSTYLKQELNDAVKILDNQFSLSAWENLNKCAMLSLLLFNRRRKAEVQLLLVEDYQRKEKVNQKTDIYASLSESEKMISMRYYHVMVRGKLGIGVPLLIDEEIARAIDIILAGRTEAGVAKNNPFLFGKGEDKYFNAYTALTDAVSQIGAEAPQLLTSRRLRTHVASVAQALALTDSDLHSLSSFLGHTKETHLQHYRMPSDALNTARISRLLVALDRGRISEFKGKKIDEINIDIPLLEMLDDDDDEQLDTTKPPAKQLRVSPLHSPKKKSTRVLLSHVATPVKRKFSTKNQLSPSPRKKLKKRWTTPEKETLKTAFSHHLTSGTLPSLTECYNIRKEHKPILDERTPTLIKAWVNNQNRKKK